MSALSIQPTFPIFTETDGLPLENGYIWIGAANLDPQGNPINVYWDAALTIPAAQPIRTLNGYPSRSGTPARLYVNSDYSIRVQNSKGSLVYSAPAATERYSDAVISGINASQVQYDPDGVGAVPTNVQDKLRQMYSVVDFGADPTGTDDSSLAIQAALDAHDYVVVPTGTYRCDNMIELNSSKTLHLFGGASLVRMSAHSASTDPVVWMKGTGCSFLGSGQNTSGVQSQNRCPIGVVSLGHRDMTQSHATVTYCTLLNMRISGALAYGQTTGNPDVALYMANPQFDGLASYFHNVSGLFVANANYGIWLCGWANANTITNIQGFTLGNTALGLNKNAFIYCNGALDNAVANVFFHNSPDSIGLLVEDYDNTAIPGGNLHQPYANSFSGYVCEQGGSAALGLKALSGGGSFYEIRHNVAGGNFTYAGFNSSNWFFGLTPSLTLTSLDVNGDVDVTGEARVAVSLIAGATNDGVNVQKINGGQAIGATSQRTYTATGTITIVVKFGLALTGAVWRSGLVEIMFDGYTAGGASRQAARYYIPIEGLSAWSIGTPVAIYGSGLTITQTANSTTSVTFTVTGTAGASGVNSIFATATSNTQARLE